MGINKGPRFSVEDIYVDYPLEEVMFRWDHVASLIYRKFHGESESPDPVPSDNRLFNDTLLYGDEISKQQYHTGKVRG